MQYVTIEDGYGGMPLKIKLDPASNRNIIELWTEMIAPNTSGDTDERLHYMTIKEAVELRDALNAVLHGALGL